MRFLCSIALVISVLASGRAAESHSTNTALAADLKKFKLAPGLKAEVVAAEPLLQNPVAFSIDGRGRFFIAESHRWATSVFDITKETPWLLDDLSFRTVNDRAAFLARQFATNFAVLTNDSELIRLVEDRDSDGIAETSSVFADGFRESTSGTASGVLAQGTNVWFTSIPDLWRFTTDDLRFTNRSDRQASPSSSPLVNRKSEIVNRLATGLGVHISVSGHDVHGLIRGHDGRIYFSFGDRGVCVTNREGVVLNVPDTGGVLRCEPDGRNLEIFCTGLRNPQELAFDDYGNLWTVDNDTAGADPCRVLHLIEGGDYGWRASYQHMKGFGPWVSEELWRGGLDGILPPAGTVSQGPAGLAFYPGTGLTPQLAGKFVHADFPGGIWAYSVKPRGASFELADKEKILWNCWPTDVDFGPDGALYVLDWVESWVRSGKGRIYRLTSTAELANTRNAEQVPEVKRAFAGRRHVQAQEKELLALLGHADRRVRLEAQGNSRHAAKIVRSSSPDCIQIQESIRADSRALGN
ncbi:MAG: PQQ-dependent sugar dehydrogenase [Verrucomicrobia bacterium]|nr:PQQ-dependent sugar dehydrogenase [Verrucomicrobiota bacterium]